MEMLLEKCYRFLNKFLVEASLNPEDVDWFQKAIIAIIDHVVVLYSIFFLLLIYSSFFNYSFTLLWASIRQYNTFPLHHKSCLNLCESVKKVQSLEYYLNFIWFSSPSLIEIIELASSPIRWRLERSNIEIENNLVFGYLVIGKTLSGTIINKLLARMCVLRSW